MSDINTRLLFEIKGVGFKNFDAKYHNLMKRVEATSKVTGISVKDMIVSYNHNARTLKAVTREQKGFKMELLSTMFAGMALSKWMSNYTKKTQDLIGVTKLHEAAMTNLFLPSQLQLAELTNAFDLWLLDLDDGTRSAIGWGVTFAQVGGDVVMKLSQIGLAWQGLEKLGIFKMLRGAGSSLTRLGGFFKGMGTKGQAMMPGGKLMGKAFKGFTKKFVKMFKSFGTKLSDLGGGASAVFSHVWDGIQWLAAGIAGVFKALVGKVVTLIAEFGIIDKLKGIGQAVASFFTWLGDNIGAQKVIAWFSTQWTVVKTAIGSFFTWLGDQVILQKIISWFTTAWVAVKGAVVGFFTWLGDQVILQKVVSFFTTAWTMVKSAVTGFFSWLGNQVILQKIATWFTTAFSAVTSAITNLFKWIAVQIAASQVGGAVGAGAKGLVGGAAAKVGLGGAAAVGAGAFGAGVIAPIAAGLGAGTVGLDKLFGGGWYFMPSKSGFNIKYLSAGVAASEHKPHYKVGETFEGAPNVSWSNLGTYFGRYGKASLAKQVYDYYNLGKGPKPPDRYAKGGIFNEPTMGIIGEAGPEAVIPLDKFSGLGTTNVEINIDAKLANDFDLDKLADRISEIFNNKDRSRLLA